MGSCSHYGVPARRHVIQCTASSQEHALTVVCLQGSMSPLIDRPGRKSIVRSWVCSAAGLSL
eukprot:1152488-Pelagomonas_calceolata.AAC.8